MSEERGVMWMRRSIRVQLEDIEEYMLLNVLSNHGLANCDSFFIVL